MSGNGNGNGKLTGKQQAFVNAYLGKAKFNGVKAAGIAGYRGDYWTLANIASENLKKPKIRSRIAEFFSLSGMIAEEVIARLTEQARAEHSQYMLLDGTIDFESLIADGKAHLVKKVKRTSFFNKDGDEETLRTEIEFYDAQAALVQICKILGIEAPKRHELSGEGGGAIETVNTIIVREFVDGEGD